MNESNTNENEVAHDANQKNKHWQIKKRYSVDQYSNEFIEKTELMQGQSGQYRLMSRAQRRKYGLLNSALTKTTGINSTEEI